VSIVLGHYALPATHTPSFGPTPEVICVDISLFHTLYASAACRVLEQD
jgi:hypothetical protein